MRDGNESRGADPLWTLARKQHGVVTLRQAQDLGRSRSAVARMVANGTLRRALPGTYVVAATPRTLEQRAMAAVLWAKGAAVASHQTAAALWGLAPSEDLLHETTSRTVTSPPRGVRCHAGSIPRRDCGTLRGIPVTGPARTLLDVAGSWPEDRTLRAAEAAVLSDLVTAEQLRDGVRRHPGRRGCRRLANVLDVAASSALERRVGSVLRSAAIPPCVRELSVGRYRLDFAWPAAMVAVEADGRRWHSSVEAFARDREKHNALTAAGWTVLRVTWADLERPGDLVAAATELLRRGRAR